MSVREYEPPKLIKPIFIEESFTAPIFNEVMASELRNAKEWFNDEKVDEVYKTRAFEIMDELLTFNSKLLKKHGFDNKKATRGRGVPIIPDEFEKVNSNIRTCRLEFIVKDEYLTDFWNIQNNLYCMFSELTIYRYNHFEVCDAVEARYCDLVIQLFKDLYNDNMVCYSLILNKCEI